MSASSPSSTAETGSSVSERVKQTIGKKMPISLSLEQIERIESLEKKVPELDAQRNHRSQKYKPTTTQEEDARSLKIGGF